MSTAMSAGFIDMLSGVQPGLCFDIRIAGADIAPIAQCHTKNTLLRRLSTWYGDRPDIAHLNTTVEAGIHIRPLSYAFVVVDVDGVPLERVLSFAASDNALAVVQTSKANTQLWYYDSSIASEASSEAVRRMKCAAIGVPHEECYYARFGRLPGTLNWNRGKERFLVSTIYCNSAAEDTALPTMFLSLDEVVAERHRSEGENVLYEADHAFACELMITTPGITDAEVKLRLSLYSAAKPSTDRSDYLQRVVQACREHLQDVEPFLSAGDDGNIGT